MTGPWEFTNTPAGRILKLSRAVCEIERQVMADLLTYSVRLTQCALDGYHGCRFTIGEEEAEKRSVLSKLGRGWCVPVEPSLRGPSWMEVGVAVAVLFSARAEPGAACRDTWQ